jgi:predicted nuclease with TOPRIM domain
MDLAAYLGTVAGMVTLAVAGMVVAVGLLGRRIDDVRRSVDDVAGTLGARIDDLGGGLAARIDRLDGRMDRLDGRMDRLDGRMDRVEAQNDAILGAVSDMGQRVARLEGHRS